MRAAVVIETARQAFSPFPGPSGGIAAGETPEVVLPAVGEGGRCRADALSPDSVSATPPMVPDAPIAPESEESAPEFVEDPFVTFTEWTDPADDEAYDDL